MNTFAQVAPRLHRAHTERKAEIRHYDEWLATKNDDLLRLRRLIAHRDLQLIRAYWKGQPSHIKERGAKLKQAQNDLARVKNRKYDANENLGKRRK